MKLFLLLETAGCPQISSVMALVMEMGAGTLVALNVMDAAGVSAEAAERPKGLNAVVNSIARQSTIARYFFILFNLLNLHRPKQTVLGLCRADAFPRNDEEP